MHVGRPVLIVAAAVAFLGLFVGAPAVLGQEDQLGSAKDRQQITAILGRWEEAWNTHDMSAFASLFHEDGVWVLWTGDVWAGRQKIEEGHAAVHKTIFRNSIQRELLEELTFVGPDAAIVRFCSLLTGSEQSPDKPVRSRKFIVVTRRQGTWKMSWGQNTRLRDDVPDSECFAKLRKPTAASHETRPDPASIAQAIDAFVGRAVSAGIAPGVGVALATDGRVIYAKAHGVTDATAGTRADDRTLWYIASTSKSLTGFGVALLAHQGALRLDDPIAVTVPRARWHPQARAQDLTLARFLAHTHNLDDNAIVSSAAFSGSIPEPQWPSLLELAAPRETPGLVYSNFGYNVAAMAIDALRPEGWRRYLEEHVYRPAGMHQTFARVSGLDNVHFARPHRLRADGRFETETFFKTDATMNSAGGHLASLNDLARWAIVQMDNGRIDGRQVFPAEAVALSHRLIAKHTNENARRFAYFDREGWGAGWDLGTYEGEPMVSRFGGYHSFRSHLSFLPRRRFGVVAVSNGGLGSPLTDAIAAFAYDLEAGRPQARDRAEQRLAELIGRRSANLQTAEKEEAARAGRQRVPLTRPLADYTGRYAQPQYGEVIISERGGRLEYRWGALFGPAETYDASRDQLRIEIAGSGQVVDFEFAATGPAKSLSMRGITFARSAGTARIGGDGCF